MGREFFEKTQNEIFLNFSESELLSQSEPQKNRVPKGSVQISLVLPRFSTVLV